jgi:hypothetical protein
MTRIKAATNPFVFLSPELSEGCNTSDLAFHRLAHGSQLRLFMLEIETRSFLLVGLGSTPDVSPGITFDLAGTGRQAISALRVAHFDLLLAGERIGDMSVWDLIRRVRALWPKQRWVYVGESVSAADEIMARCLGATMVLQQMPDSARLFDLAASLLERRGARITENEVRPAAVESV